MRATGHGWSMMAVIITSLLSLVAVHGHLRAEHVVGASAGILHQDGADAFVHTPGGVNRPSAVGRHLLQVRILNVHVR